MYRRPNTKTLAQIALLTLTMALAGCGQDVATSPPSGTFAGQPVLLPEAERPAALGAFLSEDFPSATALVSSEEGGSVSLGRYTLSFPPGALTRDTAITIRQADPVTMQMELEPHGIQFEKPVVLSVRVGDVVEGAKVVGVAWHNENTGSWEVVGEKDGAAEFAEAELWHFSGYQVWTNE
jgi:hypothetical protein